MTSTSIGLDQLARSAATWGSRQMLAIAADMVVVSSGTGVLDVEHRATGQHIDLDDPHDTTSLDDCSGLLGGYSLGQMLM